MPSASEHLISAIKSKDLGKVKQLLELGVSPNVRLIDSEPDDHIIRSKLDALEHAALIHALEQPALIERWFEDNKTTNQEDETGDSDSEEEVPYSGPTWDLEQNILVGSDYDSEGHYIHTPPNEAYDPEEEYHDEQVRQEWYPIQHASYLPYSTDDDRDHKSAIMTTILDHNPNLFATFTGKFRKSIAHQLGYLDNTEEESGYLRQCNLYNADSGDQHILRGPRTVLHSLFEDGAYIHPILTHPTFTTLNLETKDQQGRTILHASCRSFSGPSIDTLCSLRDIYITQTYEGHGYARHPKPVSYGNYEQGFTIHLLKNGANPYARDDLGKNAAHHVMESFDAIEPDRMPYTTTTYRYLHEHHPELFDMQDETGLYPIHTALRRYMYFYHLGSAANWDGVQHRDDLERFIASELRDNWNQIDSQGNTVLHYLAGLDFWSNMNRQPVRDLFFELISVDPTLSHRNKQGRTALKILFADDTQSSIQLIDMIGCGNWFRPEAEVADEIWGAFDKEAKIDWGVIDGEGKTLLHNLAGGQWTRRPSDFRGGASRLERLLGRGVDSAALDSRGRTAFQVAIEAENQWVIDALKFTETGYDTDTLVGMYAMRQWLLYEA